MKNIHEKKSVLHFLHHNEIDKEQWNTCIKSSPSGLIYAQSFYLDNMCPGWKALTGEHYDWVFPITDKTKFGISYLYQPPFTQQLGVFARPGIIVPYKEIIHWLRKHFKFWEINWNYATDDTLIIGFVQATAGTNFILDLSQGYDNIFSKYHNHLKRKLRQSKQFNLKYNVTENYNEYIDEYVKNYGMRTPHVKLFAYERFKNICGYALNHNFLICREAVNQNNELIALALLFYDGKRIYNLINMTTELGRETEASHFLLDSIIQEFSERKLLFDFEGSDLPGVKTFYGYFGAINQPYYKIKYNNLPWLIKLIKK